MNAKKGSITIEIPSAATSKTEKQETGKDAGVGGLSWKARFQKIWVFYTEDNSRIIFSVKVGVAVLLVSLLMLFEAPYQKFGTNITWAIFTVIIMFEYTVGATFNRGFNRALGSLLAVALAIAAAQIADSSSGVAEPVVIGISIFLIGTITSCMKLWPTLVPYEYGFRVMLLTFCMIVVCTYRMGSPIKTSIDRLYLIAIGSVVTILVNVLVFPNWAGEQLHKELVKCFESVADSLEECAKKYLEDESLEHHEFAKTVVDEFPDEPAYRKCRDTLNSSARLDSLAQSAKWEPPHGRFQHFCYPWSEYVKVGSVLRYCAYEVMALYGILHSDIQAPFKLRITFRSEIEDVATQAAELVRSLGKDTSNMNWSLHNNLLKRVHSSAERLQNAIDIHSHHLTSCLDPDKSSKLLPKLSHPSTNAHIDHSSAVPEFDSSCLEKSMSSLEQRNTPSGAILGAPTETYHEMMRKLFRRTHSWPSRAVDAFEEEGGLGMDCVPRMKELNSTAVLSLATFTSSLIEFVARLDHLVDAVEELARMAKFKHEEVL